MQVGRVAAVTLSAGAVLAATQAAWWQRRYTDAPKLACAVYGQMRRFERSQSSAETMQLRREFAPLLLNTDPIFTDKDGTVVTVRDAAADVVEELGDDRYRLTETYFPVKLITCCPLPKEHDCARLHFAVYSQADFDELRQVLLDENR